MLGGLLDLSWAPLRIPWASGLPSVWDSVCSTRVRTGDNMYSQSVSHVRVRALIQKEWICGTWDGDIWMYVPSNFESLEFPWIACSRRSSRLPLIRESSLLLPRNLQRLHLRQLPSKSTLITHSSLQADNYDHMSGQQEARNMVLAPGRITGPDS